MKKAAILDDNSEVFQILVPEVGLEPTKPDGGRFTVSCDCHYTIPACIWSRFRDSNPGPAVYKTAALTS